MEFPNQPSPRLDPGLESLLARLRRQLRAYVWLRGLAVVVAALGCAFWVSLAIDYWQEPSSGARVMLLVVFGVAILLTLIRWLLSRIFVPLSDRSLALLLERRFRQFDDSLLTTVELAERDPQASPLGAMMVGEAGRKAALEARQVNTSAVFNRRPLARALAAAGALAVSIIVFAATAPEALAIWSRRTLLLSDELWPRSTRLEIEGFADGRVKVARGSDLQLVVKADTAKEVPDVVEVRFRTDEGAWGRENMVREGVADPERDPFQHFSYTFEGLLTSREFDVVGGDDRLEDLRIEVVDSPAITGMTLYCEYPSYMVREELDLYTPRELPVSEFMQLPLGSRVTVRAQSNKELVKVQVTYPTGEKQTATETIDLSSRTAPDERRGFEFTLDALDDDKTLLFTLFDTDGIHNREPVRLSIGAKPDEPPQVAVRLRGIGTAITSLARLPIEGEITDDYGLQQAWFEYAIDDEEPQRRRLLKQSPQALLLKLEERDEEAFDVRDELQLSPKQKLSITIKASDNYDLEEMPHVGSAQRYVLEVVTPEQLRLLMEARELNLRRRFETIIEEVTRTRESLSAATFDVAPASQQANEAEEAASTADELESRVSLASLIVQRALQNARKNAQETLGVATSFDDIRLELTNNRLDTEELKGRLKDRISDPLKKIVEERFSELELRLEKLRGKLLEAELGPEALAQSQQQLDLIVVEMQQVLSQMLELETFNEAIALLRSIMESQQQINEKTRQQRRKLLED